MVEIKVIQVPYGGCCMYLARQTIKNKTHYIIRQSYAHHGCLKSRDLFDLGTDPGRFIIYPGGNSYYYDPAIEEALAQKGLEVDQDALDTIFFDFLKSEIQRVITGFDRGYKRNTKNIEDFDHHPPVHMFDKRRYHFLRFGRSNQRHIHRLPQKIFSRLFNKSRDEIEQYFLKTEGILKPNEKAIYIEVIFELNRFQPQPDTDISMLLQKDAFFLDQLCRLDHSKRFWAGTPKTPDLHDYLIKYVIMYFDEEPARESAWTRYIHDFMNRHRIYRPPEKVRIKIQEAEKLFGVPWKQLKSMAPSQLSRKYRQLALKHHPDQGGNPDVFRRLTEYYRRLLHLSN